jgi:hypothetical protein
LSSHGPAVAEVGYVKIAGGIHSYSRGQHQACCRGRSVVTEHIAVANARDSRDRGVEPFGIAAGDGPHPIVSRVRNVELAGGIDRDPFRAVQRSADGGSVVARIAGVAVAGHCNNAAIPANRTNAVVSAIRDIECACAVYGEAAGGIQLGHGCRTAVAREARRPVAGVGSDDTGR